MRKTNPISHRRRRLTDEIVQNEAKLGETGVYGQRRLPWGPRVGRGVKCAKRTQFIPGWGRPAEEVVRKEPNLVPPGANMQNKMPASKVGVRRIDLRYPPKNAGRSLTWGLLSWASNKPNLGRERKASSGYARPPIRSGPGSTKNRSVRNEPNFPASQTVDRGNCAKRSQTWRGWGMWGKAVLVWGAARPGDETCKTNPIWSGRRRVAEAKCAKRTQFGAAGGEMRKTNPICGPDADDCGLGSRIGGRDDRVAHGGSRIGEVGAGSEDSSGRASCSRGRVCASCRRP
jgi:hypothetical protein